MGSWLGETSRQIALRLEQNSTEWGLPVRRAWLFVAAPIVGGILVAGTLVNRDLYRFVTAEDSALEWPQFFAILVASAVLAALSMALWRDGHRLLALTFGTISLGALVVAGEEISWGQRILGFATPEALEDINHQGETNIHNIGVVQRAFNFLQLMIGLYGLVVPIAWTLNWLRPTSARLFWLFVPPVALSMAFFMAFAYRAARIVASDDPRFVVVKFGEWPELCLYVGILGFSVLALRRYRRDRGASSA